MLSPYFSKIHYINIHYTRECSRFWIKICFKEMMALVTHLPERRPERGNTGFGAPLKLDQDLSCICETHMCRTAAHMYIYIYMCVKNPYEIFSGGSIKRQRFWMKHPSKFMEHPPIFHTFSDLLEGAPLTSNHLAWPTIHT